jgi:hypothetical protein
MTVSQHPDDASHERLLAIVEDPVGVINRGMRWFLANSIAGSIVTEGIQGGQGERRRRADIPARKANRTRTSRRPYGPVAEGHSHAKDTAGH